MQFKLLDRLGLSIVRGFTRELRAFRKVLQEGIDSYRVVNHLPPLYAAGEPDAPAGATRDDDGFLHQGDFLSVWLIEELAAEFNVPIGGGVDLERLAIERGWVDKEGKFLMLPLVAQSMDASSLEVLVSASVARG